MQVHRPRWPSAEAVRGGALDRAKYLRPIAHRGLHDRAKGRIENTAPAFLAAIDKGYGIECDLQAAKDGTPMVFHDDKLDGSWARRAHQPHTPAEPRAPALQGPGHAHPHLRRVPGPRRRPGAAAGGGEDQQRHAAHTFLDRIARQARAYKGPIALMSFDLDVVAALAKLAPTDPARARDRQPSAPPRWWAAPGAAGSATIARLLNRTPPGSGFLAVDVKHVARRAGLETRHAIDLPLFSWTIRTRRERAAAARWADAPIFEGYEA